MNTSKGSVGIWVVILALLVIGGLAYFLTRTDNPPPTTNNGQSSTTTDSGNNTSTSTASNSMIRVTSPKINEAIGSPYTFNGEARGNWYFEASFPVTLHDANGKQIGQGIAQAQGEWMTTNFVPFQGSITFTAPTTTTGVMVFHKDNPSGLPQNDAEIRVPVRFNTSSTQERTVSLYYYNESKDKNSAGTVLCSAQGLVAVERRVPITNTPIQDTIRLLLRGEITSAERSSGISTGGLPLSGVGLTGASLSGGVLTLTFTDPENSTSGGSCKVSVLRAMIERTAQQFEGVASVQLRPTTAFQP